MKHIYNFDDKKMMQKKQITLRALRMGPAHSLPGPVPKALALIRFFCIIYRGK